MSKTTNGAGGFAPREVGPEGAAPKGQHTPGPWTVENEKRARGYMTSVFRDGFAIADIPCLKGDPYDDPEADANARLIAAAPDLLAALRDVMGGATEAGGLGGAYITVSGDTIRAARAAIARATGGGA